MASGIDKTSKPPSFSTAVASASTHNNPGWTRNFLEGRVVPQSSAADELPVIPAHYEFMLLMQPQVSKFPRDHRHSLGRQIEDLLHAVLRNLIRAKFSRERRAILE